MKYEFDVVIIGAGIAGGLSASVLAKAELRVLILEAGDEFHQRQDYLNRFYSADNNKKFLVDTAYPMFPQARFPTYAKNEEYVIQSGPTHEQFQTAYVRMMGGTTLYWLGTALRMHPNDYQIQTLYGIGKDWPISYQELEPWYCAAEREIGVSGLEHDIPESPMSHPYPMPEIKMSYLGKLIKHTIEGQVFDDKKIMVSHTPQARNSVAGYQNRPACAGFHNCIPICPVQAKYDALVHLKIAKQFNAEIQAQSVAYQVVADSNGDINHVKYMRWDGSKHQVTARVYLLAAHAIEIPKLLLNSRTNEYSAGIANRSDQVGRNLMDHPHQMSYALTKEPVYPMRSSYSTSGVESLNDGAFRKHRAAFRLQISDTGWAWPTGAPYSDADQAIDAGLFGDALNHSIKDTVSRQLSFNSLVEMLPDPNNRVTLAPEVDILGIPQPAIKFKIDDYARAGLARARDFHKMVFKQLQVTDEHHLTDDQWLGSGHIIGTTTMGDHPLTSVVDKNLRCHDHKNLFILGSSVFPSSFTSNPTLTIAALALRAADHIKKLFV